MGRSINYQITVRVTGEPSKEAIFKVYDYLRRCHAEQTNTTPRGPISFAEPNTAQDPKSQNIKTRCDDVHTGSNERVAWRRS